MGNILVSERFFLFGHDLWSFSGCLFAGCWLILLFYFLFKSLIEKPWTSNAENQRAIAETNTKRRQRFEEVEKRVETQDQTIRDEILSLTLFELRDALQSGKYTATKVLYAYAWRALKVQDELNCLCEFLIESFDEAESLDKKFENDDGSKPPLFGVPFSVKNNFYVKGYDCCIGLAQYLNDPKTEDCTFVTQLRNLGAIPFVTTNVPQSLLSYTCSNPVYGTTLNPHNPKRTCGGSSGGEACLLASGGTPFALGSDIGGSLRIPAIFCGISSLKPTQDRYVVENAASGIPGRSRLGLSFGFFTKTVAEQCFLLELILGTEDYKKLITRGISSIPFRKEIFDTTSQSKKLRIGYFSNDGFLQPIPGCARVVEETVEKLRAEGYEMVKFNVPQPEMAASCLFRSILVDGGVFFSNLYNNDIVDEHMKQFATLLKVPKWLRSIVGVAIGPSNPQAAIIARAYVQTAEDVRITNADLDSYNKQFTDLWNELQIDALLCPAFTVPPVEHHQPSRLGACAFSTAFFNMLDFPAGIVPTGKVSKQDDHDLMDEAKWPTGSNFILKLMRTASKDSAGLPLAVQIVTKPFEEEKCLGVMSVVEKAWKEWVV